MLDLGWSEMAVIALVALLVLGPKELPNALRTVAFWVKKARKLAREFQSGMDELVREAELEEAKKTIQSVNRVNVGRELEKTIDPGGEVTRSLNSDLHAVEPSAPDAAKSGASKPEASAPAAEAKKPEAAAGVAPVGPAPVEPVPLKSAEERKPEPAQSPSSKSA